MLSSIYSKLRGDVSGVKNEDSAQGFVRSTTKYWVRTTDISAVKHHILQHLPVFQYNQGSVNSASDPCPAFSRLLHDRWKHQRTSAMLRLELGSGVCVTSRAVLTALGPSSLRGSAVAIISVHAVVGQRQMPKP